MSYFTHNIVKASIITLLHISNVVKTLKTSLQTPPILVVIKEANSIAINTECIILLIRLTYS